MNDTDLNVLLSTTCNMCAKRDGCMPHSDEDLIYGVKHGHVPMIGECGYFKEGTQKSKEIALENLSNFKEYSKNLVGSFER